LGYVAPGYNDEIATLPVVARNDGQMKGWGCQSLFLGATPLLQLHCLTNELRGATKIGPFHKRLISLMVLGR
ncbi:MAG TPA: hypothetical protein VN494_08565, partial [Patescibacteria group bacterium]|nr:hypothetical protein [Patescibacteria group bacterium]